MLASKQIKTRADRCLHVSGTGRSASRAAGQRNEPTSTGQRVTGRGGPLVSFLLLCSIPLPAQAVKMCARSSPQHRGPVRGLSLHGSLGACPSPHEWSSHAHTNPGHQNRFSVPRRAGTVFSSYRELAPVAVTVSAAGAGGVGTVEVSGSGTSFRTSSSSLNRSPN